MTLLYIQCSMYFSTFPLGVDCQYPWIKNRYDDNTMNITPLPTLWIKHNAKKQKNENTISLWYSI